ncbi:MAG: serine/threonine-protein phosphatase [Leptospiraceae bacterium]|nr:serine/threonine-protein phosphatase [Leptospiraceae bacterium]MDW8306775.1 SpoIIE family protein phosphatase [Leptospiraceae bacterium]
MLLLSFKSWATELKIWVLDQEIESLEKLDGLIPYDVVPGSFERAVGKQKFVYVRYSIPKQIVSHGVLFSFNQPCRFFTQQRFLGGPSHWDQRKNEPRLESSAVRFLPEEAGQFLYIVCKTEFRILRFFAFEAGDLENLLLDKYRQAILLLLIHGLYFIFGVYLIILAFFPTQNRLFFVYAGLSMIFLALFLYLRRNVMLYYIFPYPYLWGYLFYVVMFLAVISIVGLIGLLCQHIPRKVFFYQQGFFFLYLLVLLALSFSHLVHPENIIHYFYYTFIVSIVVSIVGLTYEMKKKPVPELLVLMVALGILAIVALVDIILYLTTIDTSLARLRWAINLLGLAIAILISVWYIRNLRLSQRNLRLLEKEVANRTRRLQESLQVIEKGLEVAREIQHKLLPPEAIREKFPGDLSFWYEPRLSVGGDIFQLHEHNSIWRIFLADTTGHDISSSLITMLLIVEYENLQRDYISPGRVLQELNRIFIQKYARLRSYFTCLVLDIDFAHKKLTYAMGGHPEQLMVKKLENKLFLNTGPILGFRLQATWSESSYHFSPGDVLCLFSDGLIEETEKGKIPLDIADLEKILRENLAEKAQLMVERIRNAFLQKLGKQSKSDDITLLVIKF